MTNLKISFPVFLSPGGRAEQKTIIRSATSDFWLTGFILLPKLWTDVQVPEREETMRFLNRVENNLMDFFQFDHLSEVRVSQWVYVLPVEELPVLGLLRPTTLTITAVMVLWCTVIARSAPHCELDCSEVSGPYQRFLAASYSELLQQSHFLHSMFCVCARKRFCSVAEWCLDLISVCPHGTFPGSSQTRAVGTHETTY